MSTKETTVKRIELESISREKVVNSVNIVIVDNYPDKFPTFVLTGKMALCRRAFRPTSAPPIIYINQGLIAIDFFLDHPMGQKQD
jgi:hypothetical protein